MRRRPGVDGILVVDLPPEEADELRRYTDPAGLAFISLIAPTTDSERARKILRRAMGFVYYISITGVTGTAVPSPDDVKRDVERLKAMTDLPIAVGFGDLPPPTRRQPWPPWPTGSLSEALSSV